VKALIVGAAGQVGRALVASAPPAFSIVAVDRAGLDLADPDAIRALVARERPAVLINAAAYTAVDRAESEPDVARRVNADAPRELAAACEGCGARMLHVSTDFVFDGSKSRPWQESDPPNPLSVYGRTKLDGERAVLEVLGGSAAVVRTAWVHDAAGRNFVRTMLALMRARPQVRVVADQTGSPTWASSLARAAWALAARPDLSGLFHWTDAGLASWYDFAVAIAEEGLAIGLLPAMPEIVPIATEDYPTPARRPAYSVLDVRRTAQILGIRPEHWRANLRRSLGEMRLA
jgi:dTDP-4-dehydrorhamnose reductase